MAMRTMQEVLESILSRLARVERRLAIVGTGGGGTDSGTTAQRDARFPAADPVSLANAVPVWFNTEKGYAETYYVPTGTVGLQVRGLLTGYPAGWYPVAGSLLTCTRIKDNGFQAAGGGVKNYPTLLWPALTNIGGFTNTTVANIVVPVGGLYDIVGRIYWSGAAAMAYLIVGAQFTGTTNEIVTDRMPANGVDMENGFIGRSVPIPAGQGIDLFGVPAAAHNMYGDGVRRRTHLALSYTGPPLANG